MEEQKNPVAQDLPKPTPLNINNIPPKVPSPMQKKLGFLLACVITSVFASWLFIATGIIRPDASKTITENREKLVLQEGEIVAEVFKRVSPSTVSIITESQAATSRFFGTSSIQEGAGSGIIISKDGYILTNKHVVPDNTTKVRIVMSDGKEYTDVKFIGRDPSNDIAFLKINGVKDLPAAEIGDSSTIEPGQKVVAIGNALGEFQNSVTSGIISGIGRPIQAGDDLGNSEQLENLFQTDAAINPGNSGGPLVNLEGKVIGINTAISQEGQAIGFAIPINDAKGMMKTVFERGKVIKPYLGVRYVTLNAAIAAQLKIDTKQGALISAGQNQQAVASGSPAEKAALRNNDIITKIDDKAVTQTATLASLLTQFAPGDKITLTVLREGKQISVSVVLEAFPES